MAITTEKLVEYTTRGAIVTMVNAENGTFFDGGEAGQLVISEPISLGSRRTQVELSIRRRVSKVEGVPVPGKIAFRYNRLDVAGTLAGTLLGFAPPLPTSTRILLDEMTARTGIAFENDDFVLEDITRSNAAPYILKAKKESLRWYGQTEVNLVNLIDLPALIRQGLSGRVPQVENSRQLIGSEDNQPYLNATSVVAELDKVMIDSPVNDASHPLVNVIRAVVPEVGQFLEQSPTPWAVRSGNNAYNLLGAKLISRDIAGEGVNRVNPALNLQAVVRLGSAETTYLNKDIVLPYTRLDHDLNEFNDIPRLQMSAVVNASDGTDWNQWINSLVAPSMLTSLPAGMNLRISGTERWVCDQARPSRTNLYGCAVLYNGARRPYDPLPYFSRCNRVLALGMSRLNTAYQGTLIFHYRAPIIVNETAPAITVGVPVNFDFAPREGQAPYTTRIASGALPPGLSINASNRLVGTVAVEGNFNYVVEFSDARGVKVTYAFSQASRLAQLSIGGLPPAARVGQPYSYAFTATGGVPPYDFAITSGALPVGLSLADPRQPVVSGTPTGAAGVRPFTIEAFDNRGLSVGLATSITVQS